MAWLSGYSKRKKVTLTGGASGAQTSFQLKLTIAYDGDMQSDFDDIRFTQSDGTTLVDAWLEVKTDDTSATVWVEFPTTPANTVEQTYYMYYGNGSAASDWDGGATFLQYHGSTTTQFIDSLSVAQPFIYEAKVKATNATHNLRFGLADNQVFQTNDAIYIISYSGGNLRYMRCADGGGAHETDQTEAPAFTSGTYYALKMVYTDSAATGYVDDNMIGAGGITTNLPNATMGIGVHVITGTFDQDWAIVRKYVSGPPTYAFGSEESAGNAMWYYNMLRRRN